jgi:hypothetical protein
MIIPMEGEPQGADADGQGRQITTASPLRQFSGAEHERGDHDG